VVFYYFIKKLSTEAKNLKK